MRAAKVLASLYIFAGSPEPPLVAYAKSTKVSHARAHTGTVISR